MKSIRYNILLIYILFSTISLSVVCAAEQSELQNDVSADTNFVSNVCPSVVRILAKRGKQFVSGTGFFVGGKGLLVTNNHVVDEADWIGVVIVSQGGKSARVHTAYPVRCDKEHDLFLISVESDVLPAPLRLSINSPKVMDDVVAVGFPGALDTALPKSVKFESGVTCNPAIIENCTPNVTKGAISKVSEGRITHDAKISSGNSGGPLLDAKTQEVVGVNTMGILDSMSAFYVAVPIENVRSLLERTDNLMQGAYADEYKSKSEIAEPKQFKRKHIKIDLENVVLKADGGDAKAQLVLGKLYMEGEIVEYDAEKGLSYIYKAAEQDDADAYYILGEAFEDGLGVKENHEKALSYFEKARSLGHKEARFRAALIYFTERKNARDGKNAYSLFADMAEEGDTRAYYWLAECYSQGIGVQKSRIKAKEYFLRSIGEGFDESKLAYGMFLIDEVSTYQEGVKIISECAAEEDPIALGIVGHWYLYGENVEEDIVKAIECFKKSAKGGVAISIHELGSFYYNGQGVNKDLDIAEKLLTESASAGITASWYMLSAVYDEKGQPGVAVKCLQEGGRLGHGLCALNLALRYHFAKGVRPNREQEIKWLRVAAAQNADIQVQKQAKGLLRSLGVSVSQPNRKGKTESSNIAKKSASSGRKKATPKEAPKPKAAAKKW